ncbi:hypothetical protein FGG08_007444 [Glutinoglossum americanum]|uniref:Uncharacterized protein n=1 Tax=Glutinoglossum americanum TaxID=1670608 RepID=A0A9P8HYU0_9PEZI|nr:hypothetical protein FGG08_007444 [Glutinoglossum americanum]
MGCKLSWERKGYLEWMNSTCTLVRGWDGLPRNWASLLAVQESELLPWSWQIHAVNDSQNGTNIQALPQHCPSTVAKLAVFAAVNIAMAILVPVLGRRDVMKQLTCGIFGQRGSRAWLLSGPITVGLHVASNAIGAYLIKSSKGYGSVNIGQLVLLWCTRPRLAWMVVALIPWRAKDSIYFSVAASTLLAEIVLQVLGSVYMGIASNYARKQKFYTAGRLTSTPHGRDALVMYAGSLLWLMAIIFAIVACLWSILGVNRHIAAVGRAIRGSRRRAERHHFLAVKQWRNFRGRLPQNNGVFLELDLLEQLLAAEYPRPRQMWAELSEKWRVLSQYLNEDSEKLKKARNSWKAQSKQLRKASRNGPPPAELLQEQNRAMETYDGLKALWRSLPAAQLLAVTGEHLSSAGSKDRVTGSMNAQEERVSAAIADLTERQRRLSNINATIEAITTLLRKHTQSTYPNSERDFLHRQIIKTNVQIQIRRLGNAKGTAKLLRLQEAAEKCGLGINLDRQRQSLIADRGSVDENGVGSGLMLDLHRDRLIIARHRSILNGWRDVVARWTAITKEWGKLDSEWTNARTRREREAAEELADHTQKLRGIAIKTIAGMFLCWIAQWVWWVGYIRVAGDS